MQETIKLKKVISMRQLYSKRRKVLEFSGKWLNLMGQPEMRGSWIIYGESGNGKTSFTIQLAKYLTQFGDVLYNSLEEGDSKSLEMACRREQMESVARKFHIVADNKEQLKLRLQQKRSADIVITDSFQYMGLTYKEYKDLKESHPDKLFIFISHVEGKHPEGRAAKKVKYDANVKIHVENYIANCISRYGGGEPFVIWAEKAEELSDQNI